MITKLRIAFLTADRNERTFWIGLLLIFIGLTWSVSVFMALIVVGAVMIIESVITSYLAQWIKTMIKKELS